ncbi:hypothetical protein L4H28_001850 [Pseudomonas aeruginosa]|uniref:hypothetical protein n=1 Tax=Pseudomonas aeruginosa TaxID=287 RepID=UPI000BB90FD4|nr:hypothetical protein [Pseudomonas aeruginosa]EKX7272950.1 hypothetical protein [Pseudomonas aeruginosa]PBY93556.1 hypothetical protein CJT43_28155 [Pseudomonas aeruginosa]
MNTEQFIRDSAARGLSRRATTVRRRVAAGMSLRDALTTPRQQPKPRRRHPWNRSQQQVQP